MGEKSAQEQCPRVYKWITGRPFTDRYAGSVDGPLLFNLVINNLILFLTETLLSNYADDKNLYSIWKDLDLIKGMLHKDFRAVTGWFYDNHMILNPKKCHYMCLWKNSNKSKFLFHNHIYWSF